MRPPTPGSWAAAERAVVRRARRRVAVSVVLAVSALLALVGGIAYGMLVGAQDRQIQRQLTYAANQGDTTLPPGCLSLVILDGSTLRPAGAPPPAGFPRWDALTAVAADGVTRLSTVERDGTVYMVRTQARGRLTVQAVFDARYQLADRRHLLASLLLAGIVGLIAAGGLGLFAARRTVAPLAEALARQRRFVADASHELRTPIAQLHTRAQILARRARLGGVAATTADLERIVGSTRLFGELVDDLLLSARLSVPDADHPQPESIDLAAVAEAAVAAESERMRERGIVVRLARPEVPLPVPGVPSALRRVVSELLANAFTHTPVGGRIDVTVRRADDGLAELVVADTGEGFDPGDADRIFDRFHLGPGTGGRGTGGRGTGGRGFGVGLALLREVVTSHGGAVEAVGEPGRGAAFTVRLPTGAERRGNRPWSCTRRAARPRVGHRGTPVTTVPEAAPVVAGRR